MTDIFNVIFKDESSRVVGDWPWDFYPGVGMFMWAEQSLHYSSEELESGCSPLTRIISFHTSGLNPCLHSAECC